MCGIIGSTIYKINRNTLNELAHRGPDERGLYEDTKISMGHTRLSIIGPSTGQQPVVSQDEHAVMVFNGEIYNYLELKNKLNNVNKSTESDTEVLLQYYITFGIEKTLQDINGMFAFVIFDKKQNKLFAARDRLGIKPLFYSLSGGFTFCSEINSIKNILGINNLSIDPMAVSMFFNTFYIASPLTIWNEIRSMDPGCYGEYCFDRSEFNIKKYWDLQKSNRTNKDIEEFETLLKDSIRLRIRSDVPYGAYLSGGIDSSLIVKNISTFDTNCKTFTAEIKDSKLN